MPVVSVESRRSTVPTGTGIFKGEPMTNRNADIFFRMMTKRMNAARQLSKSAKYETTRHRNIGRVAAYQSAIKLATTLTQRI